MRVTPPTSYRRMPWKNGGGVTTEIAVSPEGAGLDAFDWRISMAHVAQDGPFSAFPGVDRTLCVLAGLGITLAFAGKGEVTLGKMSDPFSFAADAAVHGKLHGEPIDDLNVMSRRARWCHAVERVDVYEAWECVAGCDVTALVCVKGEIELDARPLPLLRGGAGVGAFQPQSFQSETRGASLSGATLLLERGERVTLRPSSAATLHAITLGRIASDAKGARA